MALDLEVEGGPGPVNSPANPNDVGGHLGMDLWRQFAGPVCAPI